MPKVKFLEKATKNILDHVKGKGSVIIEVVDNNYYINIDGADLSHVIGNRGESLDALQHLLTSMFYKEFKEWPELFVDINEYRVKRKEKLEEIAKTYIDKMRFFGDAVEMPVMKAYERRQIHMFVAEYPDVETESVGEGINRRVVIKPKKS